MQKIKHIRRNSTSDLVRKELIRNIKNGNFENGVLPSEDKIAAMFGVSRITIRDALANLENLGYISRIQGKGTIVNQLIAGLTGRISEGKPFTELIRSEGYEPSVTGGKAVKLPMADDIRIKLNTDSADMYRVEKLFLGDGKPMVYGVNYFSTDYINDDILKCPIDDTLVFTMIQERFDFPAIAYDIIDVHPYAAEKEIAEKLDIPEGTPMLMFESVSIAQNEQPLMVNREYYHPDKIRFHEVRSVDYHMNAL